MNLTYILIIITGLTCFITRKKHILNILLTINVTTALFSKIVNEVGLLAIIIFYVITYLYFQIKDLSKSINRLFLLIMILMMVGFIFHIMPGFYNTLAINQLVISPLSVPFSMYINFDKAIAGIILFINSDLCNQEKILDLTAWITTFLLLSLCSLMLVLSGLLFGYIKFDCKIPEILLPWCGNNLFFVCLAEEVMFRGIIQNKLRQTFLDKYFPNLYLIVTSLAFGAAHFRQGIVFIILASIAGMFYGIAYEKTKRLLSSIIVHFGLNLVHLLFFTYPAAAINTIS